jgi:hypothetical protein
MQGRHLQTPLVHTDPAAQAFPQVPQSALLVDRSAQMPLQSVVPEGHAQSPLVQMRLPPHTCEQKPQLFSSV